MKHRILIFILVLAACGAQNATPIVENVTIELAVEPDPPTAGQATLIVTVTEADGTPIDGATVAVHGDMDHEGMTPVDAETTENVGGVYRVPFEWTMGGGWILDVTVTLPDNRGIATAQFERFVGAISQDSIVNRDDTGHDLGIQIHYMPDNDPAIAGDGRVTVIVTNAEGQPVNDAGVSLVGTMPQHEMPPVTAETQTAENGRYIIPVHWTMAGEWDVEITVTLDDGQVVTQTVNQTVVTDE